MVIQNGALIVSQKNKLKLGVMKSLRIAMLLLSLQFSAYAQTAERQSETFVNANANASDKVTDNSILDFYTIDEMTLGNVFIPLHTRFSATVRLYDGRAYLKARSIKIGDDIYEIDWSAVGPDYKEGIPYEVEKQSFEVYTDQKVIFKAFVK
jgi:hypothetical protein